MQTDTMTITTHAEIIRRLDRLASKMETLSSAEAAAARRVPSSGAEGSQVKIGENRVFGSSCVIPHRGDASGRGAPFSPAHATAKRISATG